MSVTRQAILVLLVVALLAVPVWASETADGSILVSFQPDVRFRLYQVATLSGGAFSPAPDFPGFSLPPDSACAAHWQQLAGELSQTDALPVQTSHTSEDGQAGFTGLTPGIYLLTGDCFSSGGLCWEVSPCLVMLEEGGTVTVCPKSSYIPDEGPFTGDEAEPELWACAVLLSALGCLILFIRKPHWK